MDDGQAETALSALAHRMRLKIFRALMAAGTQGLPHGELAQATGLPLSNLSFHLAKLESAGLVSSRREGRIVRYLVETPAIRELLSFLTQDCCAGQPEACELLIDRIVPLCCD